MFLCQSLDMFILLALDMPTLMVLSMLIGSSTADFIIIVIVEINGMLINWFLRIMEFDLGFQVKYFIISLVENLLLPLHHPSLQIYFSSSIPITIKVVIAKVA